MLEIKKSITGPKIMRKKVSMRPNGGYNLTYRIDEPKIQKNAPKTSKNHFKPREVSYESLNSSLSRVNKHLHIKPRNCSRTVIKEILTSNKPTEVKLLLIAKTCKS